MTGVQTCALPISDMDKATSSESIGNQMSETVVPSSDQIVESGLIQRL